MCDACKFRRVVFWAVAAATIALCSSCSRRPGESSSAGSAARKETSPSKGSAARLSNEPPENTFEHPALQEQLIHERWHGDLDGIVKRRILRVLVAPNKLGFYFDGSTIHGALYEFCREFERFLNHKLHTGNLAIHLAYIPVGRDNLLPKLADGFGDLVATMMVSSSQPQYSVDFTDPLYEDAKAVIVSGPGEQLSRLEDLSGRQVYYFSNTIPYENLRRLSADLQRDGKPPIDLTPAGPDLQMEDLLEMVNAGLVQMTVAEDKVAQYWAKVLPNLKIHSHIVVAASPLAWAVQQNTPQLKSVVNEFIRDHKVGTVYGNTVTARYLSSIKWVKDAISGENLAHFEEMVRLFRTYGNKYHFPLSAFGRARLSGVRPTLSPEEQGRSCRGHADQTQHCRCRPHRHQGYRQDRSQYRGGSQIPSVHGESLLRQRADG